LIAPLLVAIDVSKPHRGTQPPAARPDNKPPLGLAI
jgi:hypothetical protein